MSRRRSRKTVLQILYRDEFHSGLLKKNQKENSSFFFKDLNKEDIPFAQDLVKGIQVHKKDIDETIEKYAEHWKQERISLVDLNIMRIAVFEILFCPDIPDKSALNEALELARQFGENKSVSFVNGILDKILKNKQVDTNAKINKF